MREWIRTWVLGALPKVRPLGALLIAVGAVALVEHQLSLDAADRSDMDPFRGAPEISHGVITWSHHMESSHGVITWSHHMESPHGTSASTRGKYWSVCPL